MVWIVYGVLCAIWGTTWLVIKDSLHYLPPITGVGLRFLLAGIFLYAVAAARGELRPLRAVPWRFVAVIAVLNFGLDYGLIYAAETHLDSGLVAVLFGTMPFFVFAFGYALSRERTTPRVWSGAAVAFAGVAIVALGQMHASPLFVLAAIGAAASAALANCYAKRESHHSPLLTLPPAMVIAGALVTCIGFSTEHVDIARAFAPQSLAALGYLAIFGSGIAFLCNFWALQRLPTWIVSLTTLIIPVIAIAAGVLFGNEHFTVREAYGSLAVIAGITIALVPRTRASKRPEVSKCAA